MLSLKGKSKLFLHETMETCIFDMHGWMESCIFYMYDYMEPCIFYSHGYKLPCILTLNVIQSPCIKFIIFITVHGNGTLDICTVVMKCAEFICMVWNTVQIVRARFCVAEQIAKLCRIIHGFSTSDRVQTTSLSSSICILMHSNENDHTL